MIFFRCQPPITIAFKAVGVVQGVLAVKPFNVIVEVHGVLPVLTHVIECAAVEGHGGDPRLIRGGALSIFTFFRPPKS